MEIQAITLEFIQNILHGFRHNHGNVPESVLQLDFVKLSAENDWEQLAFCSNFVSEYVKDRLNHFRQILGVPVLSADSEASVKAALVADFRLERHNLETWSALYYRYIEDDFQLGVAEMATLTGQNLRRFQRCVEEGIKRVQRVFQEEELKAHTTQKQAIFAHELGAPDYQNLIGNENLQDELVRLLCKSDGPLFISVEGIGGIGKTALAHAIANKVIKKTGIRVFWISARQEKFDLYHKIARPESAANTLEDIVNRLFVKLGWELSQTPSLESKLSKLTLLFRTQPALIVLDNLETIEDVQTLIPCLHPFAGVSRFLITSRESLRQFQFVEIRHLPELSEHDSKLLISNELEKMDSHIYLSDLELKQIYAVVGGIPLALKLIAAQLDTLLVPQNYIKELQQIRGESIENLFNYIYRRTWCLLHEESQRLLFAIYKTLSPEGASARWIFSMGTGSNLSEGEVENAIHELRHYSLLETRQSGSAVRYMLHRLTISFLKKEFMEYQLGE